MCGIAGFVDFNNRLDEFDLKKMVSAIGHRGPNNIGTYFINSKDRAIGLGHARLSILDLSSSANQPMHFENYSIVFNGEIYNFKEIRQKLQDIGFVFKTNSDTEVVLQAFKEWGIKCVDFFIGMYSICIYDKYSSKIYFIRDRVGVKPLFYYKSDNVLMFSSELKSFYTHSIFKKEIDLNALTLYFQFGYIPAPNTIFKNCFKLKPGHILEFDIDNNSFNETNYWDISNFYNKEKYSGSYLDAKGKLNDLLNSACNYRMISDVPVGVFLSGGYDSSGVTAIIQKNRNEKLNTFTIGFDSGINEAPYAKEIAKYLRTNHTEYYCTSKEAKDIIQELPFYFDEPFADSSAIPTILVSKLAKKNVTVALSADGGDEIFGGYNTYSTLNNKVTQLSKIPKNARGFTSNILKFISKSNVLSSDRINNHLIVASNSLHKSDILQATRLYNFIQSLPLFYRDNIFNFNKIHNVSQYDQFYDNLCPIENAMLNDFKAYLPDDILTKVDRSTMSVGLEGREPLLDHRIIEFAATLPSSYKFDDFQQKKIFKDLIHDYIPKTLLERPKMGFSIPIHAMLRGELNHLLDLYLNNDSLSKSNLFNVGFILDELNKYKSNSGYFSNFIWRILMFQMWYFTWIEKK
jgi:asparagine synthase (glutamine-hydrolysing)